MTDETTPTPAKKRRWVWWLGGGAAVLVIISALGGQPSNTGSSKTPPSTPAAASTDAAAQPDEPVTEASAAETFDAYQANQLAAAKRFADRPLQVSGTIAAIDESMGTPMLNLTTSNQFMAIGAEFPTSATNQLATMAKGERVVVRCEEISEAPASCA